LKNLIKTAYKPLINRIEKFWKTFEIVWNKENKPYGLEIQTVRFGGLILRMKQCITILEDYIKGKTNLIDELEQELLDPEIENYKKPHDSAQCMYVETISANAYTHFRP
jgi:transposase